MTMTFEKFALANRLRCEKGFGHMIESWTEADWMIATIGELGEAANVLKKLNRERDNIRGNSETFAELRDKLKRELADTAIYLDLYFQRLGTTMEDEIRRVWNAKSEQLGYAERL